MQATNPRISVSTVRRRRPEPDLPPAHNYPVPTKRPTLGGPNPPALLTHRHSISVSSDRNACPCAAATAWAVVPLTTLTVARTINVAGGSPRGHLATAISIAAD